MTRVCFVTCRRWPEISESDHLVARALEERGAPVEGRAWNEPAAGFEGFDAIVLRSNWDYHFDPEAFLAWLDRLERAGAGGSRRPCAATAGGPACSSPRSGPRPTIPGS